MSTFELSSSPSAEASVPALSKFIKDGDARVNELPRPNNERLLQLQNPKVSDAASDCTQSSENSLLAAARSPNNKKISEYFVKQPRPGKEVSAKPDRYRGLF